MDDFFEFIILPIIGAALVFCVIYGAISAGDSIDKQNEEKQRKSDKRYELCLKNHKDWVDGNCVTAVK